MSVVAYSLARDGNLALSRHFRVREWRSKCGSDRILICRETARMLQAIRDHYGAPVTLLSGYRTPEHNRRVGGAPDSYHMRGQAADIAVAGRSPAEVFGDIEAGRIAGVDPARIGLGLYGTFVHIDSRGTRARW